MKRWLCVLTFAVRSWVAWAHTHRPARYSVRLPSRSIAWKEDALLRLGWNGTTCMGLGSLAITGAEITRKPYKRAFITLSDYACRLRRSMQHSSNRLIPQYFSKGPNP